MRKTILQLLILLLCSVIGNAQAIDSKRDSVINNLVHTPGYRTSELGAIPTFVKLGRGKQTLILLPGLGFDASVFKDFMETNKKEYTMYAITIPGFGNTPRLPRCPQLVRVTVNKPGIEG